jgi:hypothetical protein
MHSCDGILRHALPAGDRLGGKRQLGFVPIDPVDQDLWAIAPYRVGLAASRSRYGTSRRGDLLWRFDGHLGAADDGLGLRGRPGRPFPNRSVVGLGRDLCDSDKTVRAGQGAAEVRVPLQQDACFANESIDLAPVGHLAWRQTWSRSGAAFSITMCEAPAPVAKHEPAPPGGRAPTASSRAVGQLTPARSAVAA